MKAAGALIGLPRELRTRDNIQALYSGSQLQATDRAYARIDRVFINHHWRRRYNDRPANHDDGSRRRDNDRRRTPVVVLSENYIRTYR